MISNFWFYITMENLDGLPLAKFLLNTDDHDSIALWINCDDNVIVYLEETIYEFVNIFIILLDTRISLYFQCSEILSFSE